MIKSRLRDSLVLLLAALLTGCSNAGYYAQAIGGHFAVMRAATPIARLMSDPASDPRLKSKLHEVQAIRDFASRNLALPDNGSYRAYADLGRPYVVWNVFAAPELSLKARNWCLLMVGCVSYRGYYDQRDAEALAAELREQGYDTYVAGVPAYSTLGYFDDPVLNTFLRFGTPEVARIVFHELAHQVVFVNDDSLFNESFATALENEGMRRWLASNAAPGQRAIFETQRLRKAGFAALMHAYRDRFRALYDTDRADGAGPTVAQRDAKAALFAALRSDYAELKASWDGYAGYDAFFGDDLNNAKLASLALYNELVPAFEALLARLDYDLPQFYRSVSQLAALDKDARRQALTRLMPAADETRQAQGSVALGAAEVR
ncbi:MAG: putative aminopeptidase [Candidatus Accumulibacter regalis]|uniref:Aminopeptidase n=1 Tax=Accumulibacter regalis TaxID=522306 RepID=A0A011R843_ACCRE|nr:aminopeptidase [Accumulibacter sp.]EXI87314.1 MAG: putative aminopeptidase [Candidatus Accumulibacter regalis]HRE72228.1 aminopeptidase [Accumulibacter sp.]